MSPWQSLVLVVALIAASAFFSIAEISLAAARRLRLRQLADEGDLRAMRVIRTQEDPGPYFTVVQVGQNAIAILGGVVGEGALTPHLAAWLEYWLEPRHAASLGFVLAFLAVSSLFIVFADLFPKRLGMNEPERLAMRVVGPMQWAISLLRPVVWIYSRATDRLFKLFGLPAHPDDRITPEDILALTEAGAKAGVLARGEQQVIANLFELDTRSVTTAMTPRERIAWFRQDDPDAVIRARISAEPFSTYPVCDGEIDKVLGYVDAKDLFQRALTGQPLSLADGALLRKVLVVPDTLSLAEVLTQFRQAGEDFAVIVNEYSLVVGLVTLQDVMSTVMGELVTAQDEDLIIQRDEHSWLVDGMAPIQDVLRALGLDELPHEDEYETVNGFMMVMLRRVPRRTEAVTWGGFRFEVVDVDSFRVDQVLVTRVEEPATPAGTCAPAPTAQP